MTTITIETIIEFIQSKINEAKAWSPSADYPEIKKELVEKGIEDAENLIKKLQESNLDEAIKHLNVHEAEMAGKGDAKTKLDIEGLKFIVELREMIAKLEK